MTPLEFRLYCDGARSREEQDTWRAAFISSNIMNCFSSRHIKPGDLLGKKKRETASAAAFANAEEFRKYMTERQAELEREAEMRGEEEAEREREAAEMRAFRAQQEADGT
jgi:hypothetical protein